MSENSKIEWCDHTFNPWIGCARVSPGCDHCYAAVSTPARTMGVIWGANETRHRTVPSTWSQPVKWNAKHAEFFAVHGRRQRVFCASLADVFDNEVDPAWRADLFELIEQTPNLDWLLLTKRIGNVAPMMIEVARRLFWLDHLEEAWLPTNAWLGATIVNQEEADRDIPKLLAMPAEVRFLSMEPLLGSVDLRFRARSFGFPKHIDRRGNAHGMPQGIHWVISGGESGHGARPAHHDWFRSLRDQCARAGVAYLHKQNGEYLPWLNFNDARIDDNPECTRYKTVEWAHGEWLDVGYPDVWDTRDGNIDDTQCYGRVGKKAAGRQLDGRTHDEFPEAK